jgi:hypothetical protein
MARILIDLSGKQFGCLTAIERIPDGKGSWMCQCSCGNTTQACTYQLTALTKISCGCQHHKQQKHLSARWTGYEEISGHYISRLKNGAKYRNLIYELSPQYLWNIYLKQNRRCALSGINIYFGVRVEQTASLDRIDNSIGYIEGNVQWIHKDINKIRGEYNLEYFITICTNIANYQKDINNKGI